MAKWVLVNFWATDCPGCISEMPDLIKTHEKYRAQGFEVLAVSMPYDPIDQVRNYSKKIIYPSSSPTMITAQFPASFRMYASPPPAFYSDQQGHVISKIVGEINFTALASITRYSTGQTQAKGS